MLKITLDFALDGLEPLQEQLNEWLAEFAPTLSGRIVDDHGLAGGGNPVAEITADTAIDLRRMLSVYAGGDEDVADDLMTEALEG